MIAHPGLLLGPAKQAGMKVPEDLDDYEVSEYPHWHVYCFIQLGRPMPTPTAHWTNAEIIAKVSDADIQMATIDDLLALGISG